MKKLWISMLAVLLLASGCGSKSASTVCTVNVSGQEFLITVVEENKKLGKITVEISQEIPESEALSDDDKEMIKELLEAQFEGYEGLVASIDFTDKEVTIKVVMEVQKMDEVPDMLEMPTDSVDELKDITYKAFVKAMESDGADCK